MVARKSAIKDNSIKAVSFDTEPTLLNGNQQKNALWESILKEHFSEEFAHYCHQQFHQWRHRNYLKQTENGIYPSLEDMYANIMQDIIDDNLLNISIDEAMVVLKQSMKQRSLQDDVSKELVQQLGIPSFIISIGNKEWLPNNLLKMDFTDILLSDEYQIPKYHDVYSLFNKACESYKIVPQDWLHVSTQYSDLVYADKHGLQTCWLNRDCNFWNHPFRPTYEISSIEALKNIL